MRGYRIQSIGPRGPFGFVVGGRSLLEGSAEIRIKITNEIGIAPFLDVGSAFRGSLPFTRADAATTTGRNFDQSDSRYSAGIGAFYVTPIGPIRVDVAAPLNPRKGDQPLALYVSIGQAF